MSVPVIAELLKQHESELLQEWIASQRTAGIRTDLVDEGTVLNNSRELLKLLGLASASGDDFGSAEWKPVRSMIETLSRTQSRQGFSPSETATFLFSLKEPLFAKIQAHCADAPAESAALLRCHRSGSFMGVGRGAALRDLGGGLEVGQRADGRLVVRVHRLPVARRL